MIETYQVEHESETRRIAADLARQLKAGDLVCLYGELGAGKTAFCQGALVALGVQDKVTSPTFTIVHEYQGEWLPVYHFDLYRINKSSDLFELGYEEYFFGEGVCFIEWAELAEDLLPEHSIKVFISYSQEPEEQERRVITIEYPSH